MSIQSASDATGRFCFQAISIQCILLPGTGLIISVQAWRGLCEILFQESWLHKARRQVNGTFRKSDDRVADIATTRGERGQSCELLTPCTRESNDRVNGIGESALMAEGAFTYMAAALLRPLQDGLKICWQGLLIEVQSHRILVSRMLHQLGQIVGRQIVGHVLRQQQAIYKYFEFVTTQ